MHVKVTMLLLLLLLLNAALVLLLVINSGNPTGAADAETHFRCELSTAAAARF
jgi:hypothetical protein